MNNPTPNPVTTPAPMLQAALAPLPLTITPEPWLSPAGLVIDFDAQVEECERWDGMA